MVFFGNRGSNAPQIATIEKEETARISKIIGDTEWLGVTIVLFFLVLSYQQVDNQLFLILNISGYALFIILSQIIKNTGIFKNKWRKIPIWAMTLFVTITCLLTGKTESPLLTLYLLPVINSALILNKTALIGEIALIVSAYILLGIEEKNFSLLSSEFVSKLIKDLFPFVLVAYLIKMLSENFRDITGHIQELSETDGLTGLLNMRGFYHTIDNSIEKFCGKNKEHFFSLLMIDSDNLKRVNDEYGHDIGNRLITKIAQLIQNNIRKQDIAARFGGDEFLMVLVETPKSYAMIIAERLRAQVNQMTFEVNGRILETSVSIGIAHFPYHGKTTKDIIIKADRAMYESKIAGKNIISVYPEEEGI